ncbi:MAG: hypothetical protein V7K25_28785 [Nostoc sp.]
MERSLLGYCQHWVSMEVNQVGDRSQKKAKSVILVGDGCKRSQ